jgi:hypothetical protein
MTSRADPAADDRELDELIRDPLVRYLAHAALAGGVAQRIAQEFFTLGAALTSHDGTQH